MAEIGTEIDYTQILEEIQINSYNLDQQVRQLTSEVTSTSAINAQNISKIENNLDVLTLLFIIFMVFEIVKIRGERR